MIDDMIININIIFRNC